MCDFSDLSIGGGKREVLHSSCGVITWGFGYKDQAPDSWKKKERKKNWFIKLWIKHLRWKVFSIRFTEIWLLPFPFVSTHISTPWYHLEILLFYVPIPCSTEPKGEATRYFHYFRNPPIILVSLFDIIYNVQDVFYKWVFVGTNFWCPRLVCVNDHDQCEDCQILWVFSKTKLGK